MTKREKTDLQSVTCIKCRSEMQKTIFWHTEFSHCTRYYCNNCNWGCELVNLDLEEFMHKRLKYQGGNWFEEFVEVHPLEDK